MFLSGWKKSQNKLRLFTQDDQHLMRCLDMYDNSSIVMHIIIQQPSNKLEEENDYYVVGFDHKPTPIRHIISLFQNNSKIIVEESNNWRLNFDSIRNLWTAELNQYKWILSKYFLYKLFRNMFTQIL